jgi:hypothetical protein
MVDGAALITGLFADLGTTERACAALTSRDDMAGDIRVCMTAETRDRLLAAAVLRRAMDGPLGAIVGALIGRRVPAERTVLYEDGLGAGGIVLGVTARGQQDAEHLEREWTEAGGTRIACPLLRRKDAA